MKDCFPDSVCSDMNKYLLNLLVPCATKEINGGLCISIRKVKQGQIYKIY